MSIEERLLDASPLWLLPILGVIFMVSQYAPGVIGKAGESWREWLRQARSAEREAREHKDEERDYWRGVADERLRELRARDALIASHVDWDRESQQSMVEAGIPVTVPPPLFPHLRRVDVGSGERPAR